MNYSYNPLEIGQNSVSRARFELGDTMVEGGAETCMLSDEEYAAILDANPKWKAALYRLADAICMKLSYETDWKDDGTSFNLNQRAERWMKLRDKLKKDAEAAGTVPVSGAVNDAIRNPEDGGHYFYAGMMQNPNVKPPVPFRGDGKC